MIWNAYHNHTERYVTGKLDDVDKVIDVNSGLFANNIDGCFLCVLLQNCEKFLFL